MIMTEEWMNITIGEALREEGVLHLVTHVGATRIVEALAARNDGDLKYVANRLREDRLGLMDRLELSRTLRRARKRNQVAAAFAFVVTRPAPPEKVSAANGHDVTVTETDQTTPLDVGPQDGGGAHCATSRSAWT